MKWVFAAGALGFAGVAGYQFLRDTKQALRAANRPRQPCDV